MTRIISGFAGSRELKVPKSGTRPTSDRVREAIFSALESRDAIAGAQVLDLYAGSGALALEALSRGAQAATMVEKNPAAATLLKSNAELIRTAGGLPSSAILVATQSVTAFLSRPSATRFDLVFIDPPYELTNEELTLILTEIIPVLAEDAEVIVERSTRTGQFSIPAGLVQTKTKPYGETTIHWLSLE